MSWGKNVFSYVLWLAYGFAVAVGLYLFSLSATEFQYEYSLVMSGGVLLASGLLVLILHAVYTKLTKDKKFSGLALLIVEGLIVVTVLAFGIALRAELMVQLMGGDTLDTFYYDAAMVAEDSAVSTVGHGAADFYMHILHILFLFMGNRFAAAVWFQVTLVSLAAVCMYFAVRELAGRIPALVMLTFLMLSRYMLVKTMALSPEWLYLIVYSLVLWILAVVSRKSNCKLSVYIFVGLLVGICCYLDLTGVTLLVFAAGIFSVERGTPKRAWNKRWVAFLICLPAIVLGWFAMIALNVVLNGSDVLTGLTEWLDLYLPEGFTLAYVISWLQEYIDTISAEAILISGIVLFILLAAGVFSFWCKKKKESQGVWIATLMLMLVFGSCQMFTEYIDGIAYLYLFAAVLTGVGIANIFANNAVCTVRRRPAQANAGAKAAVDKDAASVKNKFADFEYVDLNAESDEAKADTAKADEAADEEKADEAAEEKKADEASEAATEEPVTQIKFLENPLPVPKKHTAKTLDYQITELENNVDFDIDISDDDDFDI